MAWAERDRSGRYRGRYRDRQGVRHTLPNTYTHPAEAERAATLKEDEERRRPAAKARGRKMTWGQWCDEWLASRKVEPGTAKRDASRVEKHLRPQWNHWALADIDRDDVQDWVDELTAKTRLTGQVRPLSPSTVHRIFHTFAASMRAAVPAKIDHSPCQKIELPELAPADEFFLEHEQVATMLACGDEVAAMFTLLATETGARWGELVGLHHHRVHLASRRIEVHEVWDLATGEVKPYPKGRKKRSIPVTDECAARLAEWMREHPPTPCVVPHRGGVPCRSGLLLSTTPGVPLDYANFRRDHWQPMCTAAGLSGVSMHDLRHTYASWLLQDGVSLEVVAKLLGHKNASVSERYGHLGSARWDDVRGVLEKARSGENPSHDPGPDGAPPQQQNDELDARTEIGDPDLTRIGSEEEGAKIIKLARRRRSTG